MNSTSTQFVPTRRIEMYDSIQGIWGDNFKTNFAQNSLPLPPIIIDPQTNFDNQSEVTSHRPVNTPPNREQQSFKTYDKVQRRLAQNREAARKSRLRKKAYVQQLEVGRMKLMELELEFKRPQQHHQLQLQGVCAGGSGLDPNDLTFSSPINRGISGFEMEYREWIEEQKRQIGELRHAFNCHRSDIELKVLVEGGMSHYLKLFEMKAVAARTDVFYVMCGMWKTSSERFFLWMGGCRPSELLKALVQQLDPLADQQLLDVYNLTQSCHQAEDALSQGMDKLQRTLSETVAFAHLTDATTATLQKLQALVSFVIQADHLRQEALQQMSRILTTPQAARGLLALGEYFQRLRSLSSLSTSHPQQST